jgi:hypothetical protein
MEVSVISGDELFICRQIYSKSTAELLRHDPVSKGTQHWTQWGREMSTVHVRRGIGAAHCDQKESQNKFVISELSHYHGISHTAPLKVLVTGCLTVLEAL